MSKEITPHYQSGRTSVDHRNIDAAGDDHAFGNEPKPFEADLRPLIRQIADDLYDSWQATPREYLANAETACLKVVDYLEDPESSPYDDMIVTDDYEPRIEITWNRAEQKLRIKDNGIGMAAVEVDQVFRHIGRSAARDSGGRAGQFGMGALSFVKFIGTDNTMVMMTHSRLNDDNTSYLVSLAGVEPIMGSLDDDEYGTEFQLTQKSSDMDVRSAIEKYTEYQRVPAIYREYDENGEEVFNEDWGDKRLYDEYDTGVGKYCNRITEPGAFDAFCCPDASDKTLLLSMVIDRNVGSGSGHYNAPWPFDVRLLDESGKVIESTNGNEGLVPCSRMEYDQMLLDAREDYITRRLLNNKDVVALEAIRGGEGDEGEEVYVIPDDVLDGDTPLPPAQYVPESEKDTLDAFGNEVVIIGPHSGRTIVSEDEWEKMDEGRAAQYVPESELDSYDVETGEGDLTLPVPKSDREALQQHDVFWKYLAQRFADQFNDRITELSEKLREVPDQNEDEIIRELDVSSVESVKESDGRA